MKFFQLEKQPSKIIVHALSLSFIFENRTILNVDVKNFSLPAARHGFYITVVVGIIQRDFKFYFKIPATQKYKFLKLIDFRIIGFLIFPLVWFSDFSSRKSIENFCGQ